MRYNNEYTTLHYSNSNHEETSSECRKDILQDNWPVLFSKIYLMKNKNKETGYLFHVKLKRCNNQIQC